MLATTLSSMKKTLGGNIHNLIVLRNQNSRLISELSEVVITYEESH